ncbi:MAG: fibronectin type III domain-containing protein [Acidobacteria bacterium]|nr:fibronectin type III domain-containing protein [Acidobacteriota bacterium]
MQVPEWNTDGSPAETPAVTEVLRVAEDTGGGAGILPEGDFLARAQTLLRLAPVQVSARVQGGSLLVRDDLPGEEPPQLFRRTFRYAVRFINRRNQTAGLSNQVAIRLVPVPPPPAGIRSELSQDRVRLTWVPPSRNSDGSTPARIAGYQVYRGEDPALSSPQKLNEEPLTEPVFEDRSFLFDKTYYYTVSIVASLQDPPAETSPSRALAVEAKDVFPPAAPPRLDGLVENGVVVLFWVAPDARDLAGYRVYRREFETGPAELLTRDLWHIPSFRDEAARGGRSYYYSVSAVDGHGNEGPPAVVTIEVKPAGSAPPARGGVEGGFHRH